MNAPAKGFPLSLLASVSQTTVEALTELLNEPYSGADLTLGQMALDGPDSLGEYAFNDALAIELARQLSEQSGLSLSSALRFVSYTGAVDHYASHLKQYPSDRKADCDFWAAMSTIRSTASGDTVPRAALTSFGSSEYWSSLHFHGTFDEVTSGLKSQMIRDAAIYPEADFARVFMTNVSAADRRLRERAFK